MKRSLEEYVNLMLFIEFYMQFTNKLKVEPLNTHIWKIAQEL
jgi:hypothetical protein